MDRLRGTRGQRQNSYVDMVVVGRERGNCSAHTKYCRLYTLIHDSRYKRAGSQPNHTTRLASHDKAPPFAIHK